ncbi:MMPL family isoform A [Micractinium conductrix]|uniref:MMPL family isoform A n=1 Tax=Micractinium conductrix TaxID=554055 RepID=A0A2P6VM78_9CHLO|nr:MMPL family isoform A [Micractinium conductrix]|eukprot:PSC75155.1 MMPL family isoform A [Micractinium conductrix]
MGLLSLAMWGGTAIKVAPHISSAELGQAWFGFFIILAIAVAWHTLAPSSYTRWRTPAVAYLRIQLFAIPFNFSTRVFDALAPDVATGRGAIVHNTFQMFMSIRIALLNFNSMGWRVPFRLHMVLQALNIAILIFFGLHNYCASKLLTSPELGTLAASVHNAMALMVMVFVPSTAILVPIVAYTQRVALLLFSWATLGWLMPTLLLLPEQDAAGTRTNGAAGAAAGPLTVLGDFVEAWLRQLKPGRRRDAEARAAWAEAAGQVLPTTFSRVLHWWALMLVTWGACCSVSSLFTQPGGTPA